MVHNLKSSLAHKRDTIFTPRRRRASPLETVHAMARATDRLLRELVQTCIGEQNRADRVCLVALGGYGRGELSPYSDIDLMLLHRDGTDAEFLSPLVRAIWDTGLTLGCVVRTPSECARILGDDLATDTALLEAAYVAGNSDFFHGLITGVVRPWFARRKRGFIDEMLEALREGIYSGQNTLYRVEPNVKSGICGLRDCQRIRWAQRAQTGAVGGQAACEPVFLSRAQAHHLSKAYEFLTSVRNELHIRIGRRLDIMEIGFQSEIAEALGFDGASALMEQYFRTAGDVKEGILAVLENAPRGGGVWSRLRRTVGAFKVAPHVVLVDGILLLSSVRPPQHLATPQWMLSVFRSAVVCHATFSTGLRNFIRDCVQHLPPPAFRRKEINNGFCELLDIPRQTGRILQQMHDTLFLEALIPEFSGLTCKVEYDSYHEYTVDQHTLLAVQAVDGLSRDEDDLVRAVYLTLSNRRQIRLAVLLHDIGKSLPGEHTVRGAIIAEQICARLGLNDPEQEQIRFLVYNHLVLSELSLRREPQPHLIDEFARRVGTQENLDLLFLLTVLDIRHVGVHAWTGWKAAQVKQVYLSTRAVLLNQSGQGGEEPAAYRLSRVDYERDVFPEEQRRHEDWLRDLGPGELRLFSEELVGFDRITVVGTDRPRFLSDLMGCLSSEGMRIVSAHVYSPSGSKALDVFHVEHDSSTTVSLEHKVENIRKKWERINAGTVTAAELVVERTKRYPVKARRGGAGEIGVSFDNQASLHHTVLEISAPDGFDLLRRMAGALSDCALAVVSAKIETRIDMAVDVFYVQTVSGKRIEDPELQATVETKIRDALEGNTCLQK